jgi:glycosyltransferase involved in cell wall biosynthesis
MTVAAIVPVHGEAPWLAEALDSLRAQEGLDEVVLVDDGSPEPVSAPAGATLVRLDPRGGPAAARDAGLAATGAELVALCDADDAWEPGKLAAQLGALARHPEAAVCVGRALVVGPDGRPTGERWRELPAGVLEPAFLGPLLYEHNPIPASSAVIRRSALEAAGGFAGPAPLASDWDLWLRLVRRGEIFVCEPAARIRYRRHPRGVTTDVAALAESQLALHAAHEALAGEEVRRRVRAADLSALAHGLARRREHAAARAALAEAAALRRPSGRDRVLAAVLAVPGLRRLPGRRAPYPQS